MPPKKREIEDIVYLQEPVFTAEQRSDYDKGVALFNRGKHWHAHEAWEAAWLPMGDETTDDAEIFLRALIQLASGLHLKHKGRNKGARNQLEKARQKFAVCPTFFMGMDCASLRIFAEYQLAHFDEDFICRLPDSRSR